MHERREHEAARLARLRAHCWPRWDRDAVERNKPVDEMHLSVGCIWGEHFWGCRSLREIG